MLAGYDKTRGMLVVFPVNPDSVAERAGDPVFLVWVLAHGGTVMGCTSRVR